MPIFEYCCRSCEHKFEELVTARATPIHCPKCDSGNTQKLVSCFSLKSTGSGAAAAPSSSGCGSCTSKNCSSCR